MFGGAMGYINGRGITRGKDHDVALAKALGIFMKLSASEGKFSDTCDATDCLTELMAAHQDKKGTPFDMACVEVMQYIHLVEARAQRR